MSKNSGRYWMPMPAEMPPKSDALHRVYMARGNKSTFEGSLPVLKKYSVSAYNWGFFSGKTQTIYPWDSRKNNIQQNLRCGSMISFDGKPYRENEVKFIKEITAD